MPGLPGPDAARRTHLRRRTALAAASALAAVVVTGGTVLALDRPGTSAPVAPTTTEPTATAAPTPSSTPSTTPPTRSETAPGVVVPTTIPDGFLLPHEGETSKDSDVTDWISAEEPILSACDHPGDPRLDVVTTDNRVIEQSGPEYKRVIGLRVFSSADEAVGWLAAQQEIAASCLGVPRGGRQTTVAQELPGPWGQGGLWVESYLNLDSTDPDDFGNGGLYTLVTRIGSAVAFSQGYGEYAPAVEGPDAEVVANLREPLDELAPRLCVFTEAGC